MTLPKGVRMLGYRNVTTSKIDASYNQSQAESPLSYQLKVDAETLSQASDAVNVYFEQLRAINPAAYDQFTYGEYRVSGEAKLNVHGLGLGYGITDRLTVYGVLPYYRADVQVKFKQLRRSNTQQIAEAVEDSSRDDPDSAVGNIAYALPEASGPLMQSVVVNTYGYKEVGDWHGTGYGDLELGATYKLVDRGWWGASLTGGAVAPTGRVDDPDLLQDVGFGDGQWDAFAESAAGYTWDDSLRFGTILRYTYQAPSRKILRVPTNRDFTMSAQKGEFDVKFGDKIDSTWLATYSFNDWFSLTPAYELNYQTSSRYESKYGAANDYLAYNSDRIAHVARLSGSVSTIQPFLKKQFLLPAQLNINVQQTVGGKNVPKVGRFEVELRVMF